MKKILLAYSGGLDTSVILQWLRETCKAEVATFTANLGQDDDFDLIRNKATQLGVNEIFVEDLRETFVKDFVFPMFYANTLYEGRYLLGTAIARPLIAKTQIEIAHKIGADAVAHGATGKGNDQVRLEFGYRSLDKEIKIIAPWRQWNLTSRNALIEYAKKHNIHITNTSDQEPPYSIDANILHTSYEGKQLEDPSKPYDPSMLQHVVVPENAPDSPTYLEIEFQYGNAVSINGKLMSPLEILQSLNTVGSQNGIGVIDIVENRYVGIKSRGVYETPGGTILLHAHRAMESITLSRGAAHLKDEIMPRYAELIYNGYWWSKEREMLQALINKSQDNVNGTVVLKLYKGTVSTVSRKSPNSLYSQHLASFDMESNYDQHDAEGFIKINSLSL